MKKIFAPFNSKKYSFIKILKKLIRLYKLQRKQLIKFANLKNDYTKFINEKV